MDFWCRQFAPCYITWALEDVEAVALDQSDACVVPLRCKDDVYQILQIIDIRRLLRCFTSIQTKTILNVVGPQHACFALASCTVVFCSSLDDLEDWLTHIPSFYIWEVKLGRLAEPKQIGPVYLEKLRGLSRKSRDAWTVQAPH